MNARFSENRKHLSSPTQADERERLPGLHPDSNSVADDVRRFRAEHPYASAAAGLGLIAVGGATVAPAILVGALNVVGFGAGGVAAGSFATFVQSAVYGGAVGAGSLFAMAQSSTAGGVVVAPVALQAASAGVVGLGAWLGFGRRDDNSEPPPASDEDA